MSFKPLRSFCSHTIDVGSTLKGWLAPRKHPSDYLAAQYRKHLFGDATLQDLPDPTNKPNFIIYAASLQTGASVRFSRQYLAEYHLGLVDLPTITLARVVTASSAFPPILCPVHFRLNPNSWKKVQGADLHDNMYMKENLYLGDGGIYDNMGLERIWDRYETVLVSDAGAPFAIKEKPGKIKRSQVARTMRTIDIMGEQSRALRKRKLVSDYIAKEMTGAYWGISTKIEDYKLTENGFFTSDDIRQCPNTLFA